MIGRIVQKLSHGQLDSSKRMCLRTRKRYRAISTARLYVTIVHLQPINVVVYNDPHGNLILELASRLDAFSAYLNRTLLLGYAPGGTTDAQEVRPTRSSRTSVRPPQISYAHNR